MTIRPTTRPLTAQEIKELREICRFDEVMQRMPRYPAPPRDRMGFGAVLCIFAAAWAVGLALGMTAHKQMLAHIERTLDGDHGVGVGP